MDKQHVADFPIGKFHQNSNLFHGPTVKIYVGPERAEFEVSKALFCHASKFFDRAFNGNFKEGVEQEMDMVEDKPSSFGALVQYIYTGRILCEEGLKPIEEITFYLEFFLLADKVGPIGQLTHPVKRLKTLLNNIDNVKVLHYKLAYQLPASHQVRVIMLHRAVEPYFLDALTPENSHYFNSREFRVEEVCDAVEGFATDLLKAVSTAFRKGREQNGLGYIRDPFFGNTVCLHW